MRSFFDFNMSGPVQDLINVTHGSFMVRIVHEGPSNLRREYGDMGVD
jgi:hypothetical protein